MKKYKFREYKKSYPRLFDKERQKLIKILGDVKIEHIGSTAVFGLGGKGIIDIIVSVQKKDINKTRIKLQDFGYEFKPHAGDNNRLFFEKDYGILLKTVRFHLHLTSNNSKIWKDAIKFRNYLRKNSKAREEYENIKLLAIKQGREGEDYRSFKKDFIKKLIKHEIKK